MCLEICVLGEWCETQGQLAEALGVGWQSLPLAKDYVDSARDDRVCLCPIDVCEAVSSAGLFMYRTNSLESVAIVPCHDCWWPE